MKFLLGFVTIFFDSIFITQHFCIYTDRRDPKDYLNERATDEEIAALNESKESIQEYNNPSVFSKVKGFWFWLTTQEKDE